MGVFDSNVKIKRAVTDPGTDNTLPSSGALSWGGITGPSAMAGTTGVDAKLVHGDRWQQIDGNIMEIYLGDETTTINGNETKSVVGNRTFTVQGNYSKSILSVYNRTLVGPEMTTNAAPRVSSFLAPLVEIHAAPHVVNDDNWMETKIWSGEIQLFHFETHVVDVSIHPADNPVSIHKMELCAFETKAEELCNGLYGLKTEGAGMMNFLNGLKNQLNGAATFVRSFELKAGADVQGPPCSLGTN